MAWENRLGERERPEGSNSRSQVLRRGVEQFRGSPDSYKEKAVDGLMPDHCPSRRTDSLLLCSDICSCAAG